VKDELQRLPGVGPSTAADPGRVGIVPRPDKLCAAQVGDPALLERAERRGRAAEFEEALQYCDAGLAAAEVPEFVRKIMEFERALVLARDVACHNVGEVEETAEDAHAPVVGG